MVQEILRRLHPDAPVGSDADGRPVDRKQLAVASLLVDASRADRAVSPEERAAVVRLIRERFGLDENAALRLASLADSEVAATVEESRLADAVRQSFSESDREDVLTMLWEVVYSDGRLVRLEEQLMRRLARALDVPDSAAELARSQAFARVGLGYATEGFHRAGGD